MPLIGYLAVSLMIFGLDQLVKYLVVTHIKLDTTVSFIPHVLSLSNVRNDYGCGVGGHACLIKEKSE